MEDFDWSKWMDDDNKGVSATFVPSSSWECSACTYVNTGDLYMCEICGEFKAGLEKRPKKSQADVRQRYPFWEIQKLVERRIPSPTTEEESPHTCCGHPLPSEVCMKILSYLPEKQRLQVASLVCWEWRTCAWALFTECNLNGAVKMEREKEEETISFVLRFLAINCPNLTSLALPPQATNEHVATLQHFKHLESLALAGWARVTEDGLLDHLPPRCRLLQLNYEDPYLDSLNLYKTKISNDCLLYLPPSLRSLRLRISLSDEGIAFLESKFVECQIST